MQKFYVGAIHPQNSAKPLILLGLLLFYMHTTPSDDKKILKFFKKIW